MGRRRRQKLPKEPVKLTINALGHDGRGIGQLESGKTVFVDMTLPGEEVMFQYTNKRSTFDEGRCTEVLTASDKRVRPGCEFFGICGGCSMQHLDDNEQIMHKQNVLHELLKHQGGVSEFEPLEPVRDEIWGYRRKARLGVKYVHKKQTALVGFREKRSAFITNITSCSVLDKRVADLIMPLRAMISDLEGRERIPQIEVACGDDEVALVFRHLEPLSEADNKALIEFAKQHGFQLYYQPGGPDTVSKIEPADDLLRLSYKLPQFNLSMSFHPMDFTQVNAGINQKMLATAMQMLDPKDGERVLDLFCGLGNFSLPIASLGADVVAVEGDQRMVERGYENARANNLDNLEFYAADLTSDISQAPWAKQTFDKILIDPPRSGAFEMVQILPKFKANTIVYVSCNPITLARDAKVLAEHGYQLKSAGVLDMFPHTAHVESIALFQK